MDNLRTNEEARSFIGINLGPSRVNAELMEVNRVPKGRNLFSKTFLTSQNDNIRQSLASAIDTDANEMINQITQAPSTTGDIMRISDNTLTSHYMTPFVIMRLHNGTDSNDAITLKTTVGERSAWLVVGQREKKTEQKTSFTNQLAARQYAQSKMMPYMIIWV